MRNLLSQAVSENINSGEYLQKMILASALCLFKPSNCFPELPRFVISNSRKIIKCQLFFI